MLNSYRLWRLIKYKEEHASRCVSARWLAALPKGLVCLFSEQIYVQIIDDLSGATLVAASSKDKEIAGEVAGKNKSEVAAIVGKLAAKRSSEKGITTVSFDRNGYLYHGRVKMLADAAREGGLKF